MYKEWRYVKDKLFMVLIVGTSLLAITPLLHMIATIFIEGGSTLLKAGLGFLTSTPPPPLSRAYGGVAPAIAGSLVMVSISVPLSVLTSLFAAILSVEYPRNPLSSIVDVLSRSLASVPTIIVSMVVYTVVVVPSRRFSLLAGAIALTIVSIPYAYTSFISALSSVPRTYKEASYAIGFSKWKTMSKVLLPIAKRAVVAGVLLTFARSMGETAALLFTVGRNRSVVNVNPLYSGDALPLLIFDFVSTPFKTYHEIAWGASFILLLAYLLTFVLIKFVIKEVRL